METLRPAAKGIRSIRYCIWALVWDFSCYSLSNAEKIAAKCALLPGGEDAAWFLVHKSFFRELDEIDEHETLTIEEVVLRVYTRFEGEYFF